MILVDQIHINKSNPFWKECDRLCFASKNLYNQALYRLNECYKSTGKYISYSDLDKELSREKQVDYINLPAKVSQQTLQLLDRNYKSFFESLRDYKKNPNKYKGVPRPPKYKPKDSGRFVVVYTDQAVSKKELKKGFIGLSKSSIKFKTIHTAIKQVRVVPNILGHYVIEILYDKQEEPKIISDSYVGIDLGLNNLATIVGRDCTPLIVNGKPLKSINQFYNKRLAELKSELPLLPKTILSKTGNRLQKQKSKKICKLTRKRNNKIKDYMHKASRKVVNYLQQNNISKAVIGLNKDWKQDMNIGKTNNQNFVAIPHKQFINMIAYKAKLLGVEVTTREESYTSKCSFVDLETIRKHDSYKGYRRYRGLFVSSQGIKINADVNGAANILRKEVPDYFDKGIEAVLVQPRVVKYLK